MTNTEIADAFERLADLLELQEANPFRVRAYRNAARVIADHPRPLADLVAEGADLDKLPGVGEAIAEKITTLVETRKLPALDEAAKKTPLVLTDLMRIPGLGPKRVKLLYDSLDVKSTRDILRATKNGTLAELPGFGDKLAAKIAGAIEQLAAEQKRFRIADAEKLAAPLIEYLQGLEGVKRLVVAGSLRRRKDTVGDIDIVITAKDGEAILKKLTQFEGVRDIVSQGDTRATVILAMNLQVDVRVVPEAVVRRGALLLHRLAGAQHRRAPHRAGPASQAQRVRPVPRRQTHRGQDRGSAVEGTGDGLDPARAARGQWRDRGGTGASPAQTGHGRRPARRPAQPHHRDRRAREPGGDGRGRSKLGYEYLAITDHTHSTRIAHGLDAKGMRRHLAAIDKLNERLKGIRLLKSAETDILEDGSLDLPDDVLAELDFVLGTIHAHFDLPFASRPIACSAPSTIPLFSGLAHPMARHIGQREPIDFDFEKICKAAAERGIFLEVNAQPARLDLDGVHCRMAKDMGVKLAISTDSHSTADLAGIRFGVDQARRGWVEAKDVINTRPLREFQKLLRKT